MYRKGHGASVGAGEKLLDRIAGECGFVLTGTGD